MFILFVWFLTVKILAGFSGVARIILHKPTFSTLRWRRPELPQRDFGIEIPAHRGKR